MRCVYTDWSGGTRDVHAGGPKDAAASSGSQHPGANSRKSLLVLRQTSRLPARTCVGVTGLALLHVRFHDRLTAEAARSVLKAYRGRYDALRDTVTETEPSFDEDELAALPVVDLLTAPMHTLADHWRA